MGLEQFNVAPDNKGGRKPEEEKPDYMLERYETAFSLDKAGEEYWKEVYSEYVEGEEPTVEEFWDMCDHTSCLPRTIKQKLADHEIVDYEGVGTIHEEITKQSKTRFGSSRVDEDADSGLAGIVNDAR